MERHEYYFMKIRFISSCSVLSIIMDKLNSAEVTTTNGSTLFKRENIETLKVDRYIHYKILEKQLN